MQLDTRTRVINIVWQREGKTAKWLAWVRQTFGLSAALQESTHCCFLDPTSAFWSVSPLASAWSAKPACLLFELDFRDHGWGGLRISHGWDAGKWFHSDVISLPQQVMWLVWLDTILWVQHLPPSDARSSIPLDNGNMLCYRCIVRYCSCLRSHRVC